MLKFEFSLQEIQLIAQALHEIPYKIAAPLLQKIDSQAQPQLKAEDGNDTTGHNQPST